MIIITHFVESTRNVTTIEEGVVNRISNTSSEDGTTFTSWNPIYSFRQMQSTILLVVIYHSSKKHSLESAFRTRKAIFAT